MELKNLPTYRLQLSNELRDVGYNKAHDPLLDEIREFGFLSPTIVSPIAGSDRFEILAQEETWFAAQDLQIHEIPVTIVYPKNIEEKYKYVRLDSPENPIAKAERYNDWLNSAPGRNKTKLAKIENCTRSNISHQIRLLSLEEPIRILLEEFKITTAHGKELLNHPAGQGPRCTTFRATCLVGIQIKKTLWSENQSRDTNTKTSAKIGKRRGHAPTRRKTKGFNR